MTNSSNYLIERLEALRDLILEAQKAAPFDPREARTDWRQAGHTDRLTRHRGRAEALRADCDPDHPLARLSARCGLDPMDEDILLIALAPALDRAFGQALAQLRRSFVGGRPDVDLTLALLTDSLAARLEATGRFAPTSKLVRWGLISVRTPRASESPGLMSRELQVPERVQLELLGMEAKDRQGQFWQVTQPRVGFDQVMLPEEAQSRLMTLLDALDGLRGLDAPRQSASIVLISGVSGTGKTTTAHAVAERLGRPLMLVDSLALSSRVADLSAALDEIFTETRLTGALLFFDDCELLFANRIQGNRVLKSLLDALDSLPDLVLLATQLEDMLDSALQRRILLRVSLDFPAPKQRHTLWKRSLPDDLSIEHDLDLAFIAEKYEFTGSQIEQAATMAAASALARASRTAEPPSLKAEDINEAARSQLRHHLAQLAVRSVTHLTLKDIILPDDLMSTLLSIISAVRNRRRIFEDWGFGERLTTGKGITMLFRGQSGTGKTLSAEILASELAMPIYRVAIPRIVSKYIGETEENLEKAFREAQVAQAILLFDEADAIFTKRVEVGTATDRYSNMEVNLLLQELERFEGVVVLTTNLDAAIDDAFERRLNFKLDFPFPEGQHRGLIWKRLLPDKAPVELSDDELAYLAERFELSGGSIKNVVLRAAYSAAEHDTTINIDLLEAAAFQEYKELGKLVST